MPQWGRPQGARGSKRRRQWEWEQARALYDKRVVEELYSDDTDTEGVGLASGKSFASNPLRFTGTDLALTRPRRGYAHQPGDSSGPSESEGEGRNTIPIPLLDEEDEELVQSALARIRRAREKGKTEVKLNPGEVEALEKRRKRLEAAAAAAAARKGSSSSGGSDREKKRSSRTISVPISAALIGEESRPSSRKRGMSKSTAHDESPESTTYAPPGYYPPQAGSHRDSPTRPRSASYQQRGDPPGRYTPEAAPPAVGHGSNRHLSDGARPSSSSRSSSRRPLPNEQDRPPTSSRHNSEAQGTIDPFEYQIQSDIPPAPQQYMQPQGRHNYSGPGEVSYSSVSYAAVRRTVPSGYPAAARIPSDPAARKNSNWRDELGDDSGEDRNRDDDVEIVVAPPPEKEKPVHKKSSSSKKRGKR